MSKGGGNWKQLLEACQSVGKDIVIKKLEAYHRQLENLEAELWADPSTYNQARKLRSALLKQDETLIRLRQMSDNDIRISLETGKVGTHSGV